MDYRTYRLSQIGYIIPSYLVYENEEILYKVERKGVIFKKEFIVKDRFGATVIIVKRRTVMISGLEIEITDEVGHVIAYIKNKTKFLTQRLEAETKDGAMIIEGNFQRNDYTIIKQDEEIAKVSRKKNSTKYHMGVAAKSEVNQQVIIGLVFAILIHIASTKGS